MLSRAARNAYSWWWASHIRTKQSKWLDQNLQDMEEKVEYILKIITEDGDSFRVRAEQYYSKRPELVNFVEDTFRGYRALADRYDHLSRELQSANRTIAIVYPERVQMTVDEPEFEDFTSNSDEYENLVPTNSLVPAPLPLPQKQNHPPKMESVVQSMIKRKSKMPKIMMSKKGLVKIGIDDNSSRVPKSSGLSKEEALDEIDRLQKDILGFQTEKEFVRSSYENALSKYREIDHNINEMHAKISNLQHEFVVGALKIKDHDAQTLMSSSALNMCKETLEKLKHKQNQFKTEAVVEHNRVKEIRKKFEALIERDKNDSDLKNLEQTIENVKDKKEKIEDIELKSVEENGALIQEAYMEKKDGNNQGGLVKSQPRDEKDDKNDEDQTDKMKDEILESTKEITITELAEKIEQLVDKVINLETDLASQTAMVRRQRYEIDELHEKIQNLEHENEDLVGEINDRKLKIKKLEEELERVQKLDKRIKIQNVEFESGLDKVSVNLDCLSKDLLVAKPDQEHQEDDVIFQPEKEKNTQNILKLDDKEELRKDNHRDSENLVKNPNEKDADAGADEDKNLAITENHVIRKDQDVVSHEDVPKWSLILSHEIEDRERMLLEEYTSTLKSFKEVKQKLNETEKRNRARSFKSAVQMKMLRNSNELKDAEIRSLNEKLKLIESKTERKRGFDLGDEGIEKGKELDKMAGIEIGEPLDLDVDEAEIENEIDEATEIEINKASNAIDEGTHRIKELVETAYSELKKARELVNGGTEERKEANDSIEHEQMNSIELVDEETQRSKEFELETTDLELKDSNLVDEETQRINHKVHEITDDERTQRRKEHSDDEHEVDEVLEVEEEIRKEIEDLRKENMELWLRFSTSFHQINRFQDSFHDLLQEIKQAQEKKQEHGNSSKQRHHHHRDSSSYSFDIRPIYRHLRDMQTEVILWLEKSGILEDDLQHRLLSLSNIQNELTELTNDDLESKRTSVPLSNYQAAKFQGEVLNMKQENVKVIEELREACDRVRMLQFDIEKTLSKLDEELGEMNKSNSSSKVPFRSLLFRSKLRRKMHKQVSQPREDS